MLQPKYRPQVLHLLKANRRKNVTLLKLIFRRTLENVVGLCILAHDWVMEMGIFKRFSLAHGWIIFAIPAHSLSSRATSPEKGNYDCKVKSVCFNKSTLWVIFLKEHNLEFEKGENIYINIHLKLRSPIDNLDQGSAMTNLKAVVQLQVPQCIALI